jgi:hypothetical protein
MSFYLNYEGLFCFNIGFDDMLLKCPNCQKNLKLSDDKMAKIDAIINKIWLKCPFCFDRFRPLALNSVVTTTAKKNDNYLESNTKSKIKDIKEHFKDRPFELRAVDIPSAHISRNRQHFYVLSVFIILTIGLCGLLVSCVKKASQQQSQGQPVVSSPGLEYSQAQISKDLAALRQKIRVTRQINQEIDYSGLESRLYKYFVKTLAPNHCQQFVAIRLWSLRTAEGFTVTGVCQNGTQKVPVLEVKWDESRMAKISLEDSPKVLEVSWGANMPSGSNQSL